MKKNRLNVRLRKGGFSVALIVVVIVLAVALNLVVGSLPATYTRWDVSTNNVYSLSQHTEELIAALDQPVKLYLLAETGAEDTYISEMLERYDGLSSNITVEYIDPVLNPYFANQYTETSVSSNSVIVEGPERSKVVDYYSIYVYDYEAYYSTGQTSVSYDGENQITSAIHYVTTEDLPVFYLLQGHGELSLSTEMTSAIDNANIQTRELSLLTQEAVPADADCVMIVSPGSDLSDEDLAKLTAYAEAGGRLLLYTDFVETEMPNLASLCAMFGLQAENGVVVEGSEKYHLRGYPHYLLPDLQIHDITSPIESNNMAVAAPVAHGILKLEDTEVDIDPLLKTSAAAFAKGAGSNLTTLEKESGDTEGPFYIGVCATLTGTEENDGGQLVWYSTSNLLDPTADGWVSGGNTDLAINTMNYLCQQEEMISIRSKPLESETLTLTAAQANLWSTVFTIVLPVLVLGCGVLVWWRRRKG